MKRLLLALLLCTGISQPSTSAQTDATQLTLVGIWEGAVLIGRENFNLAFAITVSDGAYSAALISRQMGVYGMPADLITVVDGRIKIKIINVDGEFNGQLFREAGSNDITRISGDWFQEGEMLPLVLLPVEKPTL